MAAKHPFVNQYINTRPRPMGRVKLALKRAGADMEYIDQYLSEATLGDYDHLLAVGHHRVE